MPDNRFQGKKVSTSWDIVLTHAQRMGVRFELDSGRRTMAEQWVLYRNYRKYGKPVAAFPLPNAPHIRLGRQAHAIDVNSLDGGENRLQRFLEKEGLHPTNPVRGEAWHLEVPESELRRYAQRVLRRQKEVGHA
jgi:hypothetical protein